MDMKIMKHLLAILVLATSSGAQAGEIDDLLVLANQGDVGAQYTLGRKYSKGDGVSRNPKEALVWLEKAALQGNADAQLELGALFVGGRGVPKNSMEAAKWFQLAAEQGRPAAQIQMARMHLSGVGVIKDDVEAYKWAKIALSQGSKPANQILVLLRTRLTAVEVAIAETRVTEFLARKAAEDAARGTPMVAPPLE